MESKLEIRVGEQDRARLKLLVLGRERPESTDADDRRWLKSSVEVCSGTMAGAVGCSLRAEDIADFRRALAALAGEGEGDAAVLPTMEDRFALAIEREDGKLGIRGHIADGPDGNRLGYHFRVEAARLPTLLQGLDAVLDQYVEV